MNTQIFFNQNPNKNRNTHLEHQQEQEPQHHHPVLERQWSKVVEKIDDLKSNGLTLWHDSGRSTPVRYWQVRACQGTKAGRHLPASAVRFGSCSRGPVLL